MNDGPKLSTRARVLRWVLVVAFAALALIAFPSWSTVVVVFCLSSAWVGGTFAGFLIDEYWPRKQHTPRDFTSVGRRRWY